MDLWGDSKLDLANGSGRVKTGLTRIFTLEKIYIKNENKLDPIVLKLSFNFLCLPFNINKRTHKQKHSQIK